MKKILAVLLALVMVFALAACGGDDPKPSENPNGPAVYTYEEDRGDFKVTWELTMYPNGVFYLKETHGLSGETTEHSGSTWTENDDGTVNTGPWANADVNKSDFFQPTGECTWILKEDGTMEPTEFVAPAPGAGAYTYEEDRGDFKISWKVILNEDGTFALEETHGMSGNLTTHTGKEWKDNGDGTVTTGAWDTDENKSEFFKPNGECTWKINSDGTCEPVVEGGGEGGGEAAGSVNPGKYTYVESKGPGDFTWSVLLMGNGNCRIDETNPSGEVTEHVAAGWVDNGDGTVTTGEWENKEVNKSEFFKPTGECTWKINADGTCEPVAEGEGGGEAAGAVNPGKYIYVESKGPGDFTWSVLLMGNGNCRIDETNPSGETTEHVAAGWTDNGDGTVTTGEWENKEVNKSEFFKPTGECTWKINADGTCEPVVEGGGEGGGEAAGSVNPGKYAYVESKGPGDFTWEILIMGNGNCRIDETKPNGETTEHVAAGWVDNGDGTVTTGKWEDPSANKSDFFAADGTCTWKINADGTCEPVV